MFQIEVFLIPEYTRENKHSQQQIHKLLVKTGMTMPNGTQKAKGPQLNQIDMGTGTKWIDRK